MNLRWVLKTYCVCVYVYVCERVCVDVNVYVYVVVRCVWDRLMIASVVVMVFFSYSCVLWRMWLPVPVVVVVSVF